MPTSMTTSSTVTARTQSLPAGNETVAYRRFGGGPARPLLFLQHFMGTLDNWNPSVGRVSRVGFSICALLSLQGDCYYPDKRRPSGFDQKQRVSPICR
jgi:hypothetical protein